MRRIELVDLLSVWVHFSRVNLQWDGVKKKCTVKSSSSVDTLGARKKIKPACNKESLGLEMEVEHSCILQVEGVEEGCGGLHTGSGKTASRRRGKERGALVS